MNLQDDLEKDIKKFGRFLYHLARIGLWIFILFFLLSIITMVCNLL